MGVGVYTPAPFICTKALIKSRLDSGPSSEVSSVSLASTCRCKAAGFNWQQKKKRLCAVQDRTAYFLSRRLVLSLFPVLPLSALTRLWVHLTTHQFCFSAAAHRFLSLIQYLYCHFLHKTFSFSLWCVLNLNSEYDAEFQSWFSSYFSPL